MPTKTAFRAVHPDFRSRNGFVWPFPGNTAEAPGPIITGNTGGCPEAEGDGLCLALTAAGMASGNIPAITVLVCEYGTEDVLGQELSGSKLRVSKAKVLRVVDFPATLRGDLPADPDLPAKANLNGANLYGANLYGANLYGANLYGANLYGANLGGANLRGANLRGADLRVADLRLANLGGANLRGADLRVADLRVANLNGANLTGANLRWANLNEANLTGANLNRADLYRADLSEAKFPTNWKIGPDGIVVPA